MKIFSTFDKQYQGIYLAKFVDCNFYNTPLDHETELSKSLDLLQDPFYIKQTLKSTNSGWNKGKFKNVPLNQMIIDILDEISDLKDFLFEIQNKSQNDSLDWLIDNFKPLSNADLLQKPERIKLYTYEFGSLLRVYGVQLGRVSVIITGIAIKLVDKMGDCKMLQEELDKMNHLKSWLKNNQITNSEQLDI